MNPNAEQLQIIKRLRDLSRSWIISLRETVSTFSTIDSVHPNYPLPSDFPFTDVVLREKMRWIEEVEGEGKRYSFNVFLEYRSNVTQDWFPVAWTLRSGPTILGELEVDYRIIHDSNPFLLINANFVLDTMLLSLQREDSLRLSSRVIQNVDPIVYPGLRGNIEIIELRTFDGTLVSETTRRMVNPRACSSCGRLLPPAGPDLCIEHLIVAS